MVDSLPRLFVTRQKFGILTVSINSSFPGSPGPLYQSEVNCSTRDLEMSFHSRDGN